MLETRLWRPAAQRRVRNAWSYLERHRSTWSSLSASALATSTSLVNAHLNERHMGEMDFGVLQNVRRLKEKACSKLRLQQEDLLQQLLAKFQYMVEVVFQMTEEAKSLKVYMKRNGPLIEFTNEPIEKEDAGDGGGVPVFTTLPLQIIEMLAVELVGMYQTELKVKWLLISEFYKIVFPKIMLERCKKEPLDVQVDISDGSALNRLESFGADEYDWTHVPATTDVGSSPLSRDVLKVYLTAWLAEVKIDKERLDEILRLLKEEMDPVVYHIP